MTTPILAINVEQGTASIVFKNAGVEIAQFSYSHSTQLISITARVSDSIISKLVSDEFTRYDNEWFNSILSMFKLSSPSRKPLNMESEYEPNKYTFKGKIGGLLLVHFVYEIVPDTITLKPRPAANLTLLQFKSFLDCYIYGKQEAVKL